MYTICKIVKNSKMEVTTIYKFYGNASLLAKNDTVRKK